MQHGETGASLADFTHEVPEVNARTHRVQDQQVDTDQLYAQFLCRAAVICLEYVEATHPKQARDGLEQLVIVANDDASPLMEG